ncbi:DMT family transporter [Sulfitobacter sp. D35]|uniref:DMT family transporter n=1 Tax=Sulfitobacter sp. D35 TaxID=3083252 RepID=UPI00296E3697|nr:DMT family transporter [Sulfitobacter sp. D35]MDW4497602.1 DMT family transporter [Sulfitobacter sp. D35]
MDNLRGALLMVLAMLGFAIEDACIKFVSGTLPLSQILVFLGLGGSVIFGTVLVAQGRPLFERAMLTGPILLRAVGEVVGTIGFVSAIAYTPLASASAILQATPLFVTLGAALFLREPVGWRRWSAILVGFLGVLLIIRPGLENFDWMSLFALQGVIGLGIRDLATRRVPPETSSMQLSFLGFLSVIPAALIMQALSGASLVAPSAAEWAVLGTSVAIGVLAYYGIVAAMRVGEVSFVTPFRYTRLPFAIVIAMTVFDERPDLMTLLGSAVIVGSGIYTVWRERKTGARRTASLPLQGPSRYDRTESGNREPLA